MTVHTMKQYLVNLKSESFPGLFKIVLTAEEPNKLRNRMNASGATPFPMVIDLAKEIEVSDDTLGSLEVMLAIAGCPYGTMPGWWKTQWNFIGAIFAFHAGDWCTIYPDREITPASNIAQPVVSAEIKTQAVRLEYKSDDESDENDAIQHASNQFPIKKNGKEYNVQ